MDQTSSIHEFHVRIQNIAYYDLTPSRTVAAASRIIAYYVFRQARSGGHLSPTEALSRGRSPMTPIIKYSTLSHAATPEPATLVRTSRASAHYDVSPGKRLLPSHQGLIHVGLLSLIHNPYCSPFCLLIISPLTDEICTTLEGKHRDRSSEVQN